MSNLKTGLAERLGVLDDLAARIHKNAIKKGFYEELSITFAETGEVRKVAVLTDDLIGMKLALIHSEVTEILEAIRKSQGTDAISDEFADVLIRLLDLYYAMRSNGIHGFLKPLAEATAAKVEVNEGRKFRHGNRF